MIQEIRVVTNPEEDAVGKSTLYDIIHTLGIKTVTDVRTVKVYRLEGVDAATAERFALAVLVEKINQHYTLNGAISPVGGVAHKEIGYKPGVMNPEVGSILKAARDLNINELVAADTSREYHFFGTLTELELKTILERLLVNKTVERVIDAKPNTLVTRETPGAAKTVSIRTMVSSELSKYSSEEHLFLNLEEMLVIQEHFQSLGRDPFDVELEVLAQTWSEHCGHKTFKARLIVDGKEELPLIERLKTVAQKYMEGIGVISAFEDNSGAFRFFEGFGVLGKVETHNSPSAIEPYGGAATGSGGVFRDIMGTGKGAKVIASTDMFCFAPPDLPVEAVPPGCLHPHYLLRRVVAGVRDYGNRMGIPTNNGSIHFDRNFRAKPTVIVGAYGIAPEEHCKKGAPRPKDIIFAIGGRTGRDGVHGCTFASGAMTAKTITVNASAVQIGNAIEEKRMFDALLVCRDKGLIRAMTDCGAGGFSSAIGEIGQHIGIKVALEKAPLKYTGLSPREILLSESQERMVCAVAPENAAAFKDTCEAFNTEAVELGTFEDDGIFSVTYGAETVCSLTMEFLHHGLPQRTMKATAPVRAPLAREPIPSPENWLDTYERVLGHWNVCSKEPIVRQYDHGVQGTNALPPFSGVLGDGPNDAVVLTPLLGKNYGLVVSHGMNPSLMRLDPYNGGLWAIAEALANLVAVGGDPRKVGLIDNFIWPFPTEEALYNLDCAVEACVDGMHLFGVPFISGKDSLSSTYRFPDGTILEIPPVLCISAFGKIPDVRKTVTADFKKLGSQIVLLGKLDLEGMAGSVYADIQPFSSDYHQYGKRVPIVDTNMSIRSTFIRLHDQIAAGNILSCHDVSHGGIAVTLAEMCIGGEMGATIDLAKISRIRPDLIFFNETAGCFLLELDKHAPVNALFGGLHYFVIGETMKEQFINIQHHKKLLCSAPTQALREAWQKPMKEVFHA